MRGIRKTFLYTFSGLMHIVQFSGWFSPHCETCTSNNWQIMVKHVDVFIKSPEQKESDIGERGNLNDQKEICCFVYHGNEQAFRAKI